MSSLKKLDSPQSAIQTLDTKGPVSTALNIDNFQKLLCNHPDREFVQNLVIGLKYGYDIGISPLPSSSILLLTRRKPDITSKCIQS